MAVIDQGVGTKAPDNCKIDQICRLFTIRGKILHNVVTICFALPERGKRGSAHPITAHYLFIELEKIKG